MKGLLKKSISGLAAFAMLFTFSIAAEKEEVVYGNLDASGAVETIYVVNILKAENEIAEDFGNYSSLKNMTEANKPKTDGDSISLETSSEKVYLEGLLSSKDMPWNVYIDYYIDGQKYQPKEAVGKSGSMEMKLRITPNFAIEQSFYDDFVIQTTIPFDGNRFSNIVANGATIANVGADKQVSHMALPGKGLEASIKADLNDFAMGEISINGILLNMDFDTSDIDIDSFTGDLKDLSSGTGQLYSGALGLNKGFSSLAGGLTESRKGIDALYSGLNTVAQNGDAVVDGANQLADAILSSSNMQLKTAFPSAPQLTWSNYSKVLGELIGVNDDMRSTARAELSSKLGISGEDLDMLIYIAGSRLPKSGVTIDKIHKALSDASKVLKKAQEDSPELTKAQSDLTGAKGNPISVISVKQLLTGIIVQEQGITPNLVTDAMLRQAYESATIAMTGMSEQERALMFVTSCNKVSGGQDFNSAIKAAQDMFLNLNEVSRAGKEIKTQNGENVINAFLTQLVKNSGNGIDQLSDLLAGLSGTRHFVTQLQAYTGGVSELARGAGELNSGFAQLEKGAKELSKGSSEMEQATKKLKDSTANMDEETKKRIDDAIGQVTGSLLDDKQAKSFVSDKNTNVKSLQFTMKTAKVAAKKQEEKIKEPEAKKSFWEKFKDLF